jgi:hypothetical protein
MDFPNNQGASVSTWLIEVSRTTRAGAEGFRAQILSQKETKSKIMIDKESPVVIFF